MVLVPLSLCVFHAHSQPAPSHQTLDLFILCLLAPASGHGTLVAEWLGRSPRMCEVTGSNPTTLSKRGKNTSRPAEGSAHPIASSKAMCSLSGWEGIWMARPTHGRIKSLRDTPSGNTAVDALELLREKW